MVLYFSQFFLGLKLEQYLGSDMKPSNIEIAKLVKYWNAENTEKSRISIILNYANEHACFRVILLQKLEIEC